METIEKVCDICGRVYECKLHYFSSMFTPIVKTSNVRLTFENNNRSTEIYDFNICQRCGNDILAKIIDKQIKRPTKCNFCEFERGPHYAGLTPEECKSCSRYNHFKLKKRMHDREKFEWLQYKRYLGEEGSE